MAKTTARTARAIYLKLQKLCLDLPEATEKLAWGHPTFRVKNKIFASYYRGDERTTMSVKTTPPLQRMLVDNDDRFEVSKYVGQHGWVTMTLEGPASTLDWTELRSLVRGSYRLVAPKKLAAQLPSD